MTLYRQRFDTFIRRYDDVGYITNRGDFSDCVVDAAGAEFLGALSREGQSLDALAAKIERAFVGADLATLKKDAAEFYDMLEQDGFVVSGESEAELDARDVRFSYSALNPKTARTDFTPATRCADGTTQRFLGERFKDRPQLTSFQIEITGRCNERCVHCYLPPPMAKARTSIPRFSAMRSISAATWGYWA